MCVDINVWLGLHFGPKKTDKILIVFEYWLRNLVFFRANWSPKNNIDIERWEIKKAVYLAEAVHTITLIREFMLYVLFCFPRLFLLQLKKVTNFIVRKSSLAEVPLHHLLCLWGLYWFFFLLLIMIFVIISLCVTIYCTEFFLNKRNNMHLGKQRNRETINRLPFLRTESMYTYLPRFFEQEN